jgi:hypothetical protein
MRFKDLARAVLVLAAAGTVAALLLPCSRCRNRVVGNERTKVYHLPECRFAPDGDEAIGFRSAANAEAAGFRPCKTCGA